MCRLKPKNERIFTYRKNYPARDASTRAYQQMVGRANKLPTFHHLQNIQKAVYGHIPVAQHFSGA